MAHHRPPGHPPTNKINLGLRARLLAQRVHGAAGLGARSPHPERAGGRARSPGDVGAGRAGGRRAGGAEVRRPAVELETSVWPGGSGLVRLARFGHDVAVERAGEWAGEEVCGRCCGVGFSW